jgi:L-iditol 2-dehydrogenase
VHAVSRGSEARDVGVLGGGPMGLMLAALLVQEGRDVTVADGHRERRQQAERLGARAAEKLAGQELVFEAVGRPETWRAALEATKPGGTLVLVGGCPGGSEVSLPATPIHYDELELRGTFHHSPAEVDRALEILVDGHFDYRSLLSEPIPLKDLPRALAAQAGGAASKTLVDPRR